MITARGIKSVHDLFRASEYHLETVHTVRIQAKQTHVRTARAVILNRLIITYYNVLKPKEKRFPVQKTLLFESLTDRKSWEFDNKLKDRFINLFDYTESLDFLWKLKVNFKPFQSSWV